jgi:hypothetical protein
VIEVDRIVDTNGNAELAKHRLKIGCRTGRMQSRAPPRRTPHPRRAQRRVRQDAALTDPRRLVHQDPRHPDRRNTATVPAAGPISVQRKVPRDGVVMVARQHLRVGRTCTGKIVTIHVEDTHFRVTCDGAQLSMHPRTTELPITCWRAKIHDPRPNPPT